MPEPGERRDEQQQVGVCSGEDRPAGDTKEKEESTCGAKEHQERVVAKSTSRALARDDGPRQVTPCAVTI